MLRVLIARRPWIAAAAILCLALAVRLGHVAEIAESPFFDAPVVDARTYADQARAMAIDGHWGGPAAPFWQPPLYPYFLGVVWWLWGGVSWLAPRLLQAVIGAGTCLLIWSLGRRALSPTTAAAAGLAAAVWGPLVLYDAELLPPVLALPLNLLMLLSLLRAHEEERPIWPLAAGLLLGMAALCVANVLAFCPVAAWWLYRSRSDAARRWLPPALLLAGTVIAVAPVTARNWVVGDQLVVVSSNAGVNAYIGNNPDYRETVNIQPGPEWIELVSRPRREGGAQTATAQSRWFLGQVAAYAASHPLDWLGLTAHKAWQFLHGAEIGRNQDLYYLRGHSHVLAALLWIGGLAFPLGLVLPLAAAGLLLGWRAGDFALPAPRLLLWYAAVYSLTVIAFFPTARYRLPVVPILLLLGAVGARRLAGLARENGWRSMLLPGAVTLAFTVLSNASGPAVDPDGGAHTQHRLGTVYHQKGMDATAVRHYRRALELDPEIREARYNLGALYAEQGRFPRAIVEFEKYRQRFPDDLQGRLALGDAYLRSGQLDPAIATYLELLATSELARAHATGDVVVGPAQVHGRLASAYGQLGRLEEATQAYRSLIELAPDSLEARYVLGRALEERELPHLARQEYVEILDRDADHHRARRRLAHVLFGEGRNDEARTQLETLVVREPSNVESRFTLASQYIVEHRGAEALEQAEAILALEPDHARANWVAGHLHQLLGDSLAGADYIERFKALHVEQRQSEIAESLKQELREMVSGTTP